MSYLYCYIDKTTKQRWSPRGHVLDLQDPRGHFIRSLALSLKCLVMTSVVCSVRPTLFVYNICVGSRFLITANRVWIVTMDF